MRMTWRLGAIGVTLTASVVAHAQGPAIPGAPALPGGPVPPAAPGVGPTTAAAAGAAPPKNIYSFFMKTPEQKAQCKAHFCQSRIGQFINNLLIPAGAVTGGLLGPICPGPNTPNAEDLAKPASSAQGAAAKIKAEEAQAKAKIAAIEYLATVDCRYYPEAEVALIAGLRAEKNECVRLAAAKALASGCCCSAKIVKALLISVNCSNKDGFPAEASELVRTYAYVALERCLRKCVEAEEDAPPEPPPAAKKAMFELLAPMGQGQEYNEVLLIAAYYPPVPETPASIYAAARMALSRGLMLTPQTLARLNGAKNVRDSMFPSEARPVSPIIPQFTMPQLTLQTRAAVQPVAAVEPSMAAPSGRTGRGNVMHIFQDAMKR